MSPSVFSLQSTSLAFSMANDRANSFSGSRVHPWKQGLWTAPSELHGQRVGEKSSRLCFSSFGVYGGVGGQAGRGSGVGGVLQNSVIRSGMETKNLHF